VSLLVVGLNKIKLIFIFPKNNQQSATIAHRHTHTQITKMSLPIKTKTGKTSGAVAFRLKPKEICTAEDFAEGEQTLKDWEQKERKDSTSATEDSAEDSDYSVEELSGEEAEKVLAASRPACPKVPAKKEKGWSKGKATWEIAGLKSEEEAKALGYYNKGDKCLKCSKVFERKKLKAVHDALCDGTIKRCGNAKKGPSKNPRKDYIATLVEKMEDFDLDVPKVLTGTAALTMEVMFQYLINRNSRYHGIIEEAMENKQFRKATKKWLDSLGDVTIKETKKVTASFPGGFKFQENEDEAPKTMPFTQYINNDHSGWIIEELYE